jgi:hypothetical protein
MPRSARNLGPGHGPAPTLRFQSPRATSAAPIVTPPAAPLTPLGTAIASSDQTILAWLYADWSRNGYLHPLTYLSDAMGELTIDRSATGTLPIEAGLVEGYASAQLTAVLNGTLTDTITQAADLLAPYRTDSALAAVATLNTPVTCSIGAQTSVGPQVAQQFTGQIRSIRVDSASRSVEIIAADIAETLRAPITLPSYGIYETTIGPETNKFAVRSQAIIDFVLRKNGIYASPPAHPEAQVSCTGHGWVAAEIGVGGSNLGGRVPVADDAWWVPGPFGMLAVRGIFGSGAVSFPQFFTAREQYSPKAGSGIGMAAWVYVGNDLGLGAADQRLFSLRPCTDATYEIAMDFTGTGTLAGFIEGPTTSFGITQAISTPAQWMYVGLHFKHNAAGTTTITFRQNGVTTAGTNTTPTVGSAIAPFLTAVANFSCLSWSNFQVWYDPNPPDDDSWPGETHTSQADIDAGLNLMPIVPDVVNEDSWTVIKDVAAAEYGLVGFDENGRFFFRSRDNATDPASVERTANADTSLLTLATTNSLDSVRNVVTTVTTATYLNFGVAIQATDVNEFDCQTGTTIFAVPLDYGRIAQFQTLARRDTATWDSIMTDLGEENGYVAVQAASPSTEVTSGLTVLYFPAGDRLGWLIVYNTSGFPIQFQTTTGNPSLGVLGFTPQKGFDSQLTTTVNEQISDAASVDVYGERSLEIPASPYRQLLPPLEAVAHTLLTELSTPLPVLDRITVNGNPELRLSDTVRVVDPKTNGTILASVVGITRQLSGGQLTDTLTLRPVFSP